MNRPDFSEYVAHFTKDSEPFGKKQHPDDPALKAVKGTAKDKLLSILGSGKIFSTPMPWTGRKAVAFTECPWWSLFDHAKRYSSYGLGFKKARLFAAGGGPAIYLRPDLHEKQSEFVHKDNPDWKGLHNHLYAFVTPFAPPYAPEEVRKKSLGGKAVDYSHEREWRVPHDFTFELKQVEFVIVRNYDDVAKFPKPLKDAIGRDNFIMMDVHKQIKRLWPTHLLGD
jgi:hypothetical protein